MLIYGMDDAEVLPHYPPSTPKLSYSSYPPYTPTLSNKNIKHSPERGEKRYFLKFMVNNWELPHYPPGGYPTIHLLCNIRRENGG